ncbi:sigma-70 family RNA polymerase sigma factor [Massilia sp. H6]|uniref:sigma-70 family RNA polymerase sigma factor n=1 Tax=Massilia sp. H6 TaxID=2970464 RepID=UPI002166E35E|nr:sigma-70 family RNA polymerase sigma factor [Massilia sp. H6]UVW30375.1 sigma-70 family RNA polymerase sigma factor [Massilia sp. H6]
MVQLRRDMLRFARLQLRNDELAEDAVQEALAAAFSASGGFEHRASMKTWVFSILKNKIVDMLRDRWNKNRIDLAEHADEDDFDVLFRKDAHWRREEKPASWGNPEQTLADRQFWDVFEACMDNLPEAMARVFSMREFLGLEADDICKELGISASNCWVILHRARMQLRLCLQQRWFGKDAHT